MTIRGIQTASWLPLYDGLQGRTEHELGRAELEMADKKTMPEASIRNILKVSSGLAAERHSLRRIASAPKLATATPPPALQPRAAEAEGASRDPPPPQPARRPLCPTPRCCCCRRRRPPFCSLLTVLSHTLQHVIKQLKPGMELSKVTLPVFILEPRSFLEKPTDFFNHPQVSAAAAGAVLCCCS